MNPCCVHGGVRHFCEEADLRIHSTDCPVVLRSQLKVANETLKQEGLMRALAENVLFGLRSEIESLKADLAKAQADLADAVAFGSNRNQDLLAVEESLRENIVARQAAEQSLAQAKRELADVHKLHMSTIGMLKTSLAEAESTARALGERVRDGAYPIEQLRKHIVAEYPSPDGSLPLYGFMAAVIRWHQDEALAALSPKPQEVNCECLHDLEHHASVGACTGDWPGGEQCSCRSWKPATKERP